MIFKWFNNKTIPTGKKMMSQKINQNLEHGYLSWNFCALISDKYSRMRTYPTNIFRRVFGLFWPLFDFKTWGAILRPLKKSEFTIVGQPLNLRPVCIAKYFIFSCFDAGFAWLKFRAPPRYFSLFLSGRSIYASRYCPQVLNRTSAQKNRKID